MRDTVVYLCTGLGCGRKRAKSAPDLLCLRCRGVVLKKRLDEGDKQIAKGVCPKCNRMLLRSSVDRGLWQCSDHICGYLVLGRS